MEGIVILLVAVTFSAPVVCSLLGLPDQVSVAVLVVGLITTSVVYWVDNRRFFRRVSERLDDLDRAHREGQLDELLRDEE